MGYHDSVNNLLGISLNGAAFQTVTTSGVAPNTTSAPFVIGSYNTGTGEFWNGRLSCPLIGKSPVGGIAALATTIRDALYANGQGLQPSKITTAQRTAWGVVSGWIDAGSLTADQIGSNVLTNNNTVTATSGYFRGGAS